MAGLGPLGNSAAGLPGVFLHTVLSVRGSDTLQANHKRQPVEVLGVGEQPYSVRTPCRQPREASHERRKRARASHGWPPASHRVGCAPAGVRWGRGADREADMSAY